MEHLQFVGTNPKSFLRDIMGYDVKAAKVWIKNTTSNLWNVDFFGSKKRFKVLSKNNGSWNLRCADQNLGCSFKSLASCN